MAVAGGEGALGQVGPHRRGGGAYTGRRAIPEVRTVAAKAASGRNLPKMSDRQYASQFVATSLKRICWLVHLVQLVLEGCRQAGPALFQWVTEAQSLWLTLRGSAAVTLVPEGPLRSIGQMACMPAYMDLLRLLLEAERQAKEDIRTARMHSMAGWTAWARRAVELSAGAGHAWTKAPQAPALLSRPAGCAEASPLALADAELAKWVSVWGSSGEQRPPRELLECDCGMPPLVGAEIRDASGRFAWKTGLGPDRFPPRLVATLPEQAHDAMAELLNRVERWMVWPDGILLTVLVGLGKPSGGCRLTG